MQQTAPYIMPITSNLDFTLYDTNININVTDSILDSTSINQILPKATKKFECESLQKKSFNYTILYIIFSNGILGNIIAMIYFYKYISYKSVNRAYIIAFLASDLVFMLLNFLETVLAVNFNYNFLCQLNNYLMHATKNLSAILLLICVINNLIRIHFGRYTLDQRSCFGQACSRPSVIFTVISVLALSYYNLWNAALIDNVSAPTIIHTPVSSLNEPLSTTVSINDEYQQSEVNHIYEDINRIKCCGYVNEFINPQLIYKLDNGILLTIYTAICVLSVTTSVMFYVRRNLLKCNQNKNFRNERDMMLSVICIAFIQSVLEIICFSKIFIKLNSVSDLENIIQNQHDMSIEQFEKLMSETFVEEFDQIGGNSTEYISLASKSFKLIIFMLFLRKIRHRIFKILRFKCKINPSVIVYKKASLQSQQQQEQCEAKSCSKVQASEKRVASCFVYNDNKLKANKNLHFKLCTFKLDDFKNSKV